MPIIGRTGRPSPADGALAASLAPDGVFRVGRGRPQAPAPRVRGRVALLAAALAMCAIPAVGIAGFGQGGAYEPGAASDAGAVLEARYQAALALGRDGRYVEARRQMLALGDYRSADAAARSYGTRAAQLLIARARALEGRRARVGRTLVANAAELAPDLPSLREARELVGGQSVR